MFALFMAWLLAVAWGASVLSGIMIGRALCKEASQELERKNRELREQIRRMQECNSVPRSEIECVRRIIRKALQQGAI